MPCVNTTGVYMCVHNRGVEAWMAIHERVYDRYRTYASRMTAVRQSQVIHKKRRTYDVRKQIQHKFYDRCEAVVPFA